MVHVPDAANDSRLQLGTRSRKMQLSRLAFEADGYTGGWAGSGHLARRSLTLVGIAVGLAIGQPWMHSKIPACYSRDLGRIGLQVQATSRQHLLLLRWPRVHILRCTDNDRRRDDVLLRARGL